MIERQSKDALRTSEAVVPEGRPDELVPFLLRNGDRLPGLIRGTGHGTRCPAPCTIAKVERRGPGVVSGTLASPELETGTNCPVTWREAASIYLSNRS